MREKPPHVPLTQSLSLPLSRISFIFQHSANNSRKGLSYGARVYIYCGLASAISRFEGGRRENDEEFFRLAVVMKSRGCLR